MRRPDPGLLAVIPVKPLPMAKSRLRGAVPEAIHADLVLAMACDTVAAVLASPPVVRVRVITSDPTVRAAVEALGAEVLPDRPDAGLNAALTHGAQARIGAAHAGPVAALTADLPALRTPELTEALSRIDNHFFPGYFAADADGTGTVLLVAPTPAAFTPRFGPGSALAHRLLGARRLDGHWPGLRRDVDTAADLTQARELGLGPHTERFLCAIASAS